MRNNFGNYFLFLFLYVVVTPGCGDEKCSCEDGIYHANYTIRAGQCPDFISHSVPIRFQDSQIGRFSDSTISFNNTIKTDITYHGCELDITQRVEHNMAVLSVISGQYTIEDRTHLSSYVSRQDYADDGTTITCDARYDVTLTKTGELSSQ
jgi:hypothetical protein